MQPDQRCKPRRTYCAYLIRCWYAENAGNPVWRVAAQEPGCETQLYFDSLAALYAWLLAQLELDNSPNTCIEG